MIRFTETMLDKVVQYLRSNGVPFRLMSSPSPESLPAVGDSMRLHEGCAVETHVLLIDGRVVLACVPRGEVLMLAQLSSELGPNLLVEEGHASDLPEPFCQAGADVPPLGGLVGAPVFIDASLVTEPTISFAVFSNADVIQVAYDDFARLERPRVATIAGGGELPSGEMHPEGYPA